MKSGEGMGWRREQTKGVSRDPKDLTKKANNRTAGVIESACLRPEGKLTRKSWVTVQQ